MWHPSNVKPSRCPQQLSSGRSQWAAKAPFSAKAGWVPAAAGRDGHGPRRERLRPAGTGRKCTGLTHRTEDLNAKGGPAGYSKFLSRLTRESRAPKCKSRKARAMLQATLWSHRAVAALKYRRAVAWVNRGEICSEKYRVWQAGNEWRGPLQHWGAAASQASLQEPSGSPQCPLHRALLSRGKETTASAV